MRSGLGVLLRQAILDLMGIETASASFKRLVVNYTTTTVGDLVRLQNVTTTNSSKRLNVTASAPGPVEIVPPTDAALNGPLPNRGNRLRMLVASASCSPVSLDGPGSTTLTVPTTRADLGVVLPYSYYEAVGAGTPEAIAAAAAAVQKRVAALLVNATAVRRSFAPFLSSFAACTGMPASVGVIAAVSQTSLSNVPVTPPATPDVSDGVIIASVLGGLVGLVALGAIAYAATSTCRMSGAGAGAGGLKVVGGAPVDRAVGTSYASAAAAAATAVGSKALAAGSAPAGGAAGALSLACAACVQAGDAAAVNVSASASAVGATRVSIRACAHTTLQQVTAATAAAQRLPPSATEGARLQIGSLVYTTTPDMHGPIQLGAVGGRAGRTLIVEASFKAGIVV